MVSLATFLAAGLSAQSVVSSVQAPAVAKEPQSFGTDSHTAVRINAFEFTPLTGAAYAWGGSGVSRYSTFGPLNSNIRVPSGAIIRRLEFDYCDTNATSHMTMALIECDNQGQNCGFASNYLTSAGDGCSWVSDTSLAVEVDNYNHIYTLEVQFGAVDGTNILGGAIVSYQLQVAPAPGSATFLDVPTGHPQFQFIEALVASGITAGCGGGNYCPGNPLTRGQMAVFLAKALGLHYSQ
jgi:hypothetical protein